MSDDYYKRFYDDVVALLAEMDDHGQTMIDKATLRHLVLRRDPPRRDLLA